MGDVQVANKTEVFGQESTLGWAGGGGGLGDTKPLLFRLG